MGYYSNAEDINFDFVGLDKLSTDERIAVLSAIKEEMENAKILDKWSGRKVKEDIYESLGYILGLKIEGSKLCFDYAEEAKAYYLQEYLVAFAEIVEKNGLYLTGSFVLYGEENGDIVKWVVDGTDIDKLEAKITFGDEV